jgi:peptidoglycan/xylan/chitin deacetylase (PgdA/CDA1 family)
MRAIALEYHDVIVGDDFDSSGYPGAGPASYKLADSDFEDHLRSIAQAVDGGPVTVSQLLDGTAGACPLFLTFDDGGRSAHSYIADALEKRGWRGHFLVTGRTVGTKTFLTPAQLRDLTSRGHVIGTHSFSHPHMMGMLSRAQLLDEWSRGAAVLSDILGEETVVASIPGGFSRRIVAETAAVVGIKLLFTSDPTMRCRTVDGCMTVGRFSIRRGTSARTAAALASRAVAPRLGQFLLYSFLGMMRAIGGDYYTRARMLFWSKRK